MTTTTGHQADTASARPTLTVERIYTTPGVHPYDEVKWEARDVVMTNWRDGTVNFEQRDVEFPVDWSVNASNIVTTKYMRGAVGTPTRERSLRQVIDRVVSTYALAGVEHGYFGPEQAEVFEHELTWMLLHQVFAFNSPVWFNVGARSTPQTSACFILAVDDSMESILNWYREEGLIFQGGSGAGVNLSRIRSSKELLGSGGTASGPVSFMRGADASAGTIKSGGATRRAAKMVVLDVDHPDIEEFVETKVREEDKIRALRDAGFDMDLGGKDIVSVQYQNANNSVRVSDAFMDAVANGGTFDLTARKDGQVLDTVDARALWRQIAEATWACADPGVQYGDTINAWHTTPESGPITASNPCSEYLSLDNSSCNLASINLMKFLGDDGRFDHERFAQVVSLVFTAMDISICFSGFPTEKIAQVTRDFRQLGIGYANLGALLMASGLAYDSDKGRDLAASITSLMTATAWARSAEMAAVVGPYAGYARNAAPHQRVIERHAQAHDDVTGYYGLSDGILAAAAVQWVVALDWGAQFGFRNAQASLLAPTGTIGLMMDCDTTGLEPGFGLSTYKKLVGGGDMVIVNQSVARALTTLGYGGDAAAAIREHITTNGTVVGAPGLLPEHYDVFDCAVGERSISPSGHIGMMAAVQPFLSGAISKTVNLPETATVEDIERVYFEGWELGLKAIAIYRNNSKVGQPLSEKKDTPAEVVEVIKVVEQPKRKRLPKRRRSQTVSFAVGGAEGYMTVGEYDDGHPGELFLKMSKQGSTLSGVMDAFAVSISLGLQHGVPLDAYCAKYLNMRFDPAGLTDDADVRMAQSIIDYLFRRLALDYLSAEKCAELGVWSADARAAQVAESYGDATAPQAVEEAPVAVERTVAALDDSPLCMTCGVKMRQAGACFVCESCGSTSGCS